MAHGNIFCGRSWRWHVRVAERYTRFMIRSHVSRTMLTIAAPLAMILSACGAPETCPPVPEVSWWGGLDHQDIVERVDQDYDGNWEAYVQKWQRQLNTVQSAHGKGQEILISGRGIRLSGQALKAYLGKVSARLETTRCLAPVHRIPRPGDEGVIDAAGLQTLPLRKRQIR